MVPLGVPVAGRSGSGSAASMLGRAVVISVVAVGMCVCWGVISAVAFACIFVFILAVLVRGWSCSSAVILLEARRSLSVRIVGAHTVLSCGAHAPEVDAAPAGAKPKDNFASLPAGPTSTLLSAPAWMPPA